MLGENEGKGPGENKIILSVCTLIDHTNLSQRACKNLDSHGCHKNDFFLQMCHYHSLEKTLTSK